ncbi:protein kinase [bacterium]|nr:protein kinase [candidate division CSSED10-310 bacterium]
MPDYIKKARKLERRKEYLRAAEYYVLAGDHEKAIELFVRENLFLKAAKLCERVGLIDQAAEHYGKIGDFKHAADLLRQAGDTFQAAMMYKRAKRFRDAAEMFEQSGVVSEAARMMEKEMEYRRAAELYMSAGMYRSAAVCFEQASELESPLAHSFGGPRIDDKEHRILLFRAAEAWRLVPNLVRAAEIHEMFRDWNRAGELYEQAGQAEAALKCYDQAENTDASIRLLKALNRYGQAIRMEAKRSGESGDHLKAAEMADKQCDWSLAAENYEQAGKYDLAAERYEKVSDFMLAAEMYFRAGDYEKAARMYELAGNIETAANLYDELGFVGKAIQLHIRNQNFTRAAQLHLNSRENDEALRLLLRVPDDHPSAGTVRKLLAICYFRLGKIETGKKYVDSVLNLPVSNENIDLIYEYACALYDQGIIDESLQAFQKIVNLRLDYKEARQYLNWLAAMSEEINAEKSDTVVGELPIGMVINNRYELLELLGKGGMGIVYRAADRELNLAVALKILRPKYSYDPDLIEMVKREVTLARLLAHPNIIKIYDLNRAGNLWFVSMEYLYGRDLKSILRESGRLSFPSINKIFAQVLSALSHSHQKKLVHSDIKPQNIFIDENERVTIVDFGIARISGDVERDKTVRGTPEYIAPEQIHGDPATVQSDLYSLGITLYEMITGQMPFQGSDINEVLEQQLEKIPPTPREIRPEVPKWLNTVTMKMIAKNPADRYRNAQEVLTAIPEKF